MKFTIECKILQEELKKLEKMKPSKDYEITSSTNYLIEADVKSQEIKIIRNEFMEVVLTLPAYVEEAGFKVLLQSTIKLIQKLPNGDILLDNDKIKLGKKEIKINYNNIDFSKSKSNFITDATATLTQKEFNRMLEVKYAIAKDETRPILQGVFFNQNETCALDGYRMSVRNSTEYNINAEFIMHPQMVEYISKIIKNVCEYVTIEYNYNTNEIRITIGNLVITRHGIEGKYIKYKSLLPDSCKHVIKFNTDEILQSCKLLSNVDNILRFSQKDSNIILTTNDKFTSMSEELSEVVIIESENAFEVACSIKYFIEALKSINSTDIVLKNASKVKPIILSNDMKNLELVLPVRIAK